VTRAPANHLKDLLMISLQNRGVPIQLERSLASASNGSAMRSVVGFAEMDAPIKGRSVADLRDYLAEERTFLAWIRTSIALMGFGFVVAHFGIFANEPHVTNHASGVQPHDLSLWFGTALIAMGVTVSLFSAWCYMHLVGELNRGQFVKRSISKQGLIVALSLALLGIAISIYMLLILAPPPNVLHA
jgi:putative membrane protein